MKSENKIKKLSEDVTNTIDSNKNISRMYIIVKELIENSIDSKANNINILIKDGGLSLIEIRDDGNGIKKSEYEKLCIRYNSSKLNDYSDLESITTFGFRGEALSILSYISTMTIISRTEDEDYGYEATYKNGKLISAIKPISFDKGTLLKLENVYSNNSLRKNHYDKNEETKEIINLLQKYTFHFNNINFSLSSNIITNVLLKTRVQTELKNKLDIGRYLSARLYSQEISDNLFIFDNEKDNLLNINFNCMFTKPSSNLDKSTLIIFVNNRLVVMNNIKKVIEQTYSKYIIKNGNYFVYLDIKCPQNDLDVNVKGNKSEVYIKEENCLINQIKYLLEENLNEEISSKNYYIGNYSDVKKKETIVYKPKEDLNENVYAKDKVRVDMKNLSIEQFLKKKQIKNDDITFSDCVNLVYKSLFTEINTEITNIIKNCFYIGYESENELSFIQNETTLYIINTKTLIMEYIMFLVFNNDSKDFFSMMKIKSEFNIYNLTDFIKQNIDDKFTINEIEDITELFNNKKHILSNLNIIMNDVFKIDEIFFIDLGLSDLTKKFKNRFLNYIPLLIYSIIKYIQTYVNKEFKNENENLNFMIEIIKIYSFYLSNLYIEYLSIDDMNANKFLKIFFQNLNRKFIIRNNLKPEYLIEKIINTETLYTVFERC